MAVLRADAGPQLGGGHVQRCRALGEALVEQGWRVAFALRAPTLDIVPDLSAFVGELMALQDPVESEGAELRSLLPFGCDLLVVDHYGRDRAFERLCRGLARRVMALDDRPSRQHDCDMLLDPTPGRAPSAYRPLVPAQCELLLGADYALLRRQFAQARPEALARRESGTIPRRLLVSIGTTDPTNLTTTVLEGVAASGLTLAVDVVLGGAAPHLKTVRETIRERSVDARLHLDVTDMAGLMSAADLAIGAAGSSSFERCCLGLPSLIVISADNQREIADALIAAEAVHSLGDGEALAAEAIAAALHDFVADDHARQRLSRNAAALCDGLGASRVATLCTAGLAPAPSMGA